MDTSDLWRPLVRVNGALRAAAAPVARTLHLSVDHDAAALGELNVSKYPPRYMVEATESVWSDDPLGESRGAGVEISRGRCDCDVDLPW